MRRNYLGLWLLLVTAFAFFAVLSVYDPIEVCGYALKSSKIVPTLTADAKTKAGKVDAASVSGTATRVTQTRSVTKAVKTDTLSKTILFIGDSMLEGLSPRLAAYASANGHTLYSVIWYSSTSEIWGRSGRLASYVQRLHPDYIFICLGANELFVRDIVSKRDKYVKEIVKEVGKIPFVWIGPPNWKDDTGINDLIAANVPSGSFFLSRGMHFDRAKDGAHPTRKSAIQWMDSVVRWMPQHCAHPIKMAKPMSSTGRPRQIFVHQPQK